MMMKTTTTALNAPTNEYSFCPSQLSTLNINDRRLDVKWALRQHAGKED